MRSVEGERGIFVTDLLTSGLDQMGEPAKDRDGITSTTLIPNMGVDLDKHPLPSTAPQTAPTDNIDISQSVISPAPSQSEVENLAAPDPGEIFYQKANITKKVFRQYKPGEEGILEFNAFDQYDPLTKHYYPNREEYERARRIYKNGGYPEKITEYWKPPDIVQNQQPKLSVLGGSKKDSEESAIKAGSDKKAA